jgi:sulfite reductase beta subunit-like hemoprotein
MRSRSPKPSSPVQRDWGDRTNRKHARLKYTIEDRGLDAFRAEGREARWRDA